MNLFTSPSRRRFLKTAIAFSAAATVGCGSGIHLPDDVGEERTHILAVGDWGKDGSVADQRAVAAAMQAYVKRWNIPTEALFMLGDNFYGTLQQGVNDTRWQTQFEQMYPASVFKGPAFAVPGNHDYQNAPASKFQAELAYAAAKHSRWTMPGSYSTVLFPADKPTATLVFLDTNMPGEPAQPPPPDPSFYTPTDADRLQQLAWLRDTLSQPLATPFLVVVGHHPLYTDGAHGDNQTLIRDLDPLFRTAGVHLYIAGHDHDMQHLEFAGHPTSFVGSGGGGAPLSPLRHAGNGPFAQQLHGFTHLQITQELMTVRHLDASGNLLHKFTKTPAGVVTLAT